MKSFLAELGADKNEPNISLENDIDSENISFEDMTKLSFGVLRELDLCLKKATSSSDEIDLNSDELKDVRKMAKIITGGKLPNEVVKELDSDDRFIIAQMSNREFIDQIDPNERVKYLTGLTKSFTKIFRNI